MNVSVDDVEKFEEEEMDNKRIVKNTWYDCLINYILESIRKDVGGFKDECVFTKNTPKQNVYGRGK